MREVVVEETKKGNYLKVKQLVSLILFPFPLENERHRQANFKALFLIFLPPPPLAAFICFFWNCFRNKNATHCDIKKPHKIHEWREGNVRWGRGDKAEKMRQKF